MQILLFQEHMVKNKFEENEFLDNDTQKGAKYISISFLLFHITTRRGKMAFFICELLVTFYP